MSKHPNSKGERSTTVYTGHVNSKKSFKYLFFEDKERLVNVLDKFNNKTMFPENIPIENKLGLLLHGPPGTGKSAVIQCVANYTKRNIVLVDLSKIKTKKELDEVLLLDPNEHLFCFEEIDTVLGCVGQRGSEDVASSPLKAEDSTKEMLAMFAMASNQAMQKEMGNVMSQKDDSLNLGYLLQKIDGIESAENRIIIATTNFPDKLDSALTRPGRFGFKLNLSYCTERMLRDIIGMMYALTETQKSVLEIPTRIINKLTPTYVIQHCFQYETVKDALESL
jgi:chaperone BCS1